MLRIVESNSIQLLLALMLLVACTDDGIPQSNGHQKPETLVRFNIGIGRSPDIFKAPGSVPFVFGIVASYQKGDRIYSMRLVDNYEFNMSWGPAEYVLEYSFLFGQSFIRGEMGYVSVDSKSDL